ncbi:dihydrolipoamide acetyltransferase family protein [Dolosicoccus paucivorans]|uniref:dihydrolipoamide acetyltransferase family protein n=1 Tax=Dolosicoccus paucivorans TaxID=84521 RepID=UPI00088119B4|nr:dihydrolipoamide acetyltransferase family protein [Dolosicoccus paucivorans]SDI83382.1 pyruvate dehydrogenase E2 component (dihydrolipoamide acetyltransferase) [Dolosicoccus paucivorans]
MFKYILPDSGEGTHESEVLEWKYEVGDYVEADATLLEIQSDKAVVELPCPVSGYLAKQYVPVGELGIVGEPIAEIAESKEELESYQSGGETSEEAPQKEEVKEEAKEQSTQEQSTTQAKDSSNEKDIRRMAVPRVRRYARLKEVDLLQVEGTGAHGKITMEDVDNFLEHGPTTQPQEQEVEEVAEEETLVAAPSMDAQGIPEDTPIKMTSMRRVIADAMAKSTSEVAQVTVFDQAVVDELVNHRNKMKGLAKEDDISLTYTAYVVKVLVGLMKKFPELNRSIDMENQQFLQHNYINIGVATDTPTGLVVPMIRNADSKSLFEIAKEIQELGEKALEGKLASSEMGKGSITVTNVGAVATSGVWSTPVINLPEIAILNVGRIDKQFMPDENDQPVLKHVMKLSFAFDHRAIDGVLAQQALNLIKKYLENPDLLLSEG